MGWIMSAACFVVLLFSPDNHTLGFMSAIFAVAGAISEVASAIRAKK